MTEPVLSGRPTETCRIDLSAIDDVAGFHTQFGSAMGFPGFYGRNMDAWFDCMVCAVEPTSEMTTTKVEPGGLLVLSVRGLSRFKAQFPHLHAEVLRAVCDLNDRWADADGRAAVELREET